MLYSLNKISFGTSKKDVVFDVDLPYDVYDFCYLQDFGFLFVLRDNHCISRIDLKGNLTVEWIGSVDQRGFKEGSGKYACLDFPSSICYHKQSGNCFVIERGGSSIRSVEVEDRYVYTLLGTSVMKKLSTPLFPIFVI